MESRISNKYDVFISHSTSSMEWSRNLANELQKIGVNVFYDNVSIPMGAPVEESIRNALEHSSSVVVVLDRANTSSHWTAFELGAAIGMGKPIVPVVSPDVSLTGVPSYIREQDLIRERTPAEAARAVKKVLSKVG